MNSVLLLPDVPGTLNLLLRFDRRRNWKDSSSFIYPPIQSVHMSMHIGGDWINATRHMPTTLDECQNLPRVGRTQSHTTLEWFSDFPLKDYDGGREFSQLNNHEDGVKRSFGGKTSLVNCCHDRAMHHNLLECRLVSTTFHKAITSSCVITTPSSLRPREIGEFI